MKPARLELSMAAVPEAVRVLRCEVLEWLRTANVADRRTRASIALATAEAVGNVVRHAYGPAPGRVELSASVRENDVLVRVTDQGHGLSFESESRTGLGLPVISRVSNGVTVASDSDGTTVSMRFALAQPRRDRFAGRLGGGHRPLLGV